MKYLLPVAAVLSLSLAACSAESDRAGDDPAQPATPAPAAVAPAPDPGEDAIPDRDVRGDGISDDVDEARFDGIGPAFFGMSDEEVRSAWPGELDGGPQGEGPDCYHLSPIGQPDQAYFAMMFGDGRFVRYSATNENLSAPGGGRVGMSGTEIEQRYGPGIQRRPHKYVEGGEYLRVDDPAGGDGVLIFATNAEDTVTEWRAGVMPQVEYVEGCS